MIHTRICDLFGIAHPIVQAGMAREYTSAELVAAVSNAGGLGILGCLGRPAEEAVAEIRRIRELTTRPFGVNFVVHLLDEQTFAACLEARVPVFSFFRGQPEQAIARAHAASARTIYQVTTLEEAGHALDAGTDALVAQGTEAGGHQGAIPLMSLLPAVVALAGPRPVLAAGGIVDGPTLAAALCLGASGALMGTRFLATAEAPASAAHKQAILRVQPGDTVSSGIPDILWGEAWPGVQARALRNRLVERWLGCADELRAVRADVLAAVHRAEAAGDPDEMILLAGAGAAQIHRILPAAEVVQTVIHDAAHLLLHWGMRIENELR
jgi:NAD(P)H-dependent flavin oxidoreductase YrpB (nitropropane dioxygenase family)